ncbi:MAG: sigma-70 family RNA polymerase sigma factor [Balneolales bacterium]
MNRTARQDYSAYEDEELMRLYQNGFNDAFRELVIRYQSSLFLRMNAFTRNREDSEDLVQDSFLCVARFKHSYSPTYKFSNWLFTIGSNQLISRYRKGRHMLMTSHITEPEDIEILQDNRLHNKNLTTSLRIAIARLPGCYATLLTMRIIEERSYQEIHVDTGLPVGTIKSRIKRGRERLRVMLRPHLER